MATSVALIVMVSMLGIVSIAAPVAAHEGGGRATGGGQSHSWPNDGCTKVPNWAPGVFNFTHACQHHDGCYVRRFSSSRLQCDNWFLADMTASCATGSTMWFNRSACLAIAASYYAGVRACGGYSWDNKSVGTPMSRLCW